jgi:hypothetical protein
MCLNKQVRGYVSAGSSRTSGTKGYFPSRRKERFMKPRILCLIILPAFARLASGGMITVSYSGTISSSGVPGILAGDPFSGYFTYSLPTPVLADESPTAILYSMSQPGDGLYLSVDGYQFSAGASTNLRMTVWPSYPAGAASDDFFQVDQNIDSPGAVFSSNYPGDFTFYQSAAQFFGNLSFLPSYAPPEPFNAGDLFFGNNGGYFTAVSVVMQQGNSLFSFSGLMDSVQATAETPEPAAALLFGGGLSLILILAKFVND